MQSFNKKLNKSGGVTLPAAIRREFGLGDGEKFSISVDSYDGAIVLRRTQGHCLFCNSEQNLITYQGRYVCTRCIKSMGEIREDKFVNI